MDVIGGFRDGATGAGAPEARSYGEALLAAALADERIVCLGADLTQPTETGPFRRRLPERFFMLGIQEANMVGVAAGLARTGYLPCAHSFCVFITRRVYDQLAMQVAYPALNVKLVGFMPGLTTELGVSHQAIDDVALMRSLPNMSVVEPSGPEQLGAVVRAALEHEGPVYLRLQMTLGRYDPQTPLSPFTLGKGAVLRSGSDAAILASGIMVREALAAALLLAERGISVTVANMASLKPFDANLAVELARRHRVLVTAENHSVVGGLGAATSSALALAGVTTRFAMIGVQDTFAQGGSTPYLLRRHGLTAEHIATTIEAQFRS